MIEKLLKNNLNSDSIKESIAVLVLIASILYFIINTGTTKANLEKDNREILIEIENKPIN